MGLDQYLLASTYGKSDLPPQHHTMFPGFGGREPNATDGYFDARALADQLHLPADNAGRGNYGSTLIEPWGSRKDQVKVTVHAGYWRKANHIHAWFVKHVQDGVDECQEAPVKIEQLQQLRDACVQALETARIATGPVQTGTVLVERGSLVIETSEVREGGRPIVEEGAVVTNPDAVAEILPTQGGFFFGSTDYDSYYLQDCEHTRVVIDACLQAHAANPKISFAYQSSW